MFRKIITKLFKKKDKRQKINGLQRPVYEDGVIFFKEPAEKYHTIEVEGIEVVTCHDTKANFLYIRGIALDGKMKGTMASACFKSFFTDIEIADISDMWHNKGRLKVKISAERINSYRLKNDGLHVCNTAKSPELNYTTSGASKSDDSGFYDCDTEMLALASCSMVLL